MLKKIRKSAVVLLSVIAVGSTMLPAQALVGTDQATVAIVQGDSEITPKAAKISLSTISYSTSIKVSWQSVPGASEYIATCGNQSKTVSATSYTPSATFTGLTSGKSYSITVNAYDSSGLRIATGSTTASTL